MDAAGRFATADAVVGTGPFVMKSVEESVGAQYVRNPNYWKSGRPYVDEVHTRHFNDDQAASAAFLAGQVDLARVPGTEVKNYIARHGANYTPEWYKLMSGIFAVPNVTAKPMDDARVTRALRLLIDQDGLKRAWAELFYVRARTDCGPGVQPGGPPLLSGAGRDEQPIQFAAHAIPVTGETGQRLMERRWAERAELNPSLAELAPAVLSGKMSFDDINPTRIDFVSLEETIAQVGQGTMGSHGGGHLGRGDRAVIMLRKLWERELRALAEGRPLQQWTYRPEMVPQWLTPEPAQV